MKKEARWPILPPRKVSLKLWPWSTVKCQDQDSHYEPCAETFPSLLRMIRDKYGTKVLSDTFLTPSQNCREGEWVFKDGAWLIVRFSF